MNASEFAALCVASDCSIAQARATLDRTARGILLVTDAQGRLQRTVTDGDLRRAALARVDESHPVSVLPSQTPVTVGQDATLGACVAAMDQHQIDHVPVVDAQGRALDVVARRELSQRIWLSSPHLGDEETAFVEEAFRTNWIAPLGPHVDGFERELAQYAGGGHAAAVSSGTAAIHLGLVLLGVGVGDTVLCSSLTFVGSCNPILYCGAKPVFVDSEPESWNMSPAALERALQACVQAGRRPKAVVVVNLYGQSADMDPIVALCEQFGVPILEDAAESLGARYKGRPSGSFGRISIFSFNGNKIITTSGGGMLVSQDAALMERARKLSTQAREPAAHYEHVEVGYNYRMSNVLAGIGRGQLRVLDQRVAQRRHVFDRYLSAFAGDGRLQWMPEFEGSVHTRWLTCFTLQNDPQGARRDRVLRYLERHSVEARPVWKPMHLQPLFAGADYHTHALVDDVSTRLFTSGICLPSGSNLTEPQIDKVIDLLGRALTASEGAGASA